MTTVEAERRAKAASQPARRARRELAAAERKARFAVVSFMDAALEAGWQWHRIGSELGIAATTARLYYRRNRRLTHGGDI